MLSKATIYALAEFMYYQSVKFWSCSHNHLQLFLEEYLVSFTLLLNSLKADVS